MSTNLISKYIGPAGSPQDDFRLKELFYLIMKLKEWLFCMREGMENNGRRQIGRVTELR